MYLKKKIIILRMELNKTGNLVESGKWIKNTSVLN